MDEQHPPPPLEYKYSGGLRNELGTSERLSGLAIAGEGSVSAAAPFRQNQEDTNATEPVEDHRKTLEARTKRALADRRIAAQGETSFVLISRPAKRAGKPGVQKSPIHRAYADQPSSDTLRTYEAHASASMEEHRWSVSDMGSASDVAIPRDSGAERGSPITCPADVTARGERYEVIDDGNSTLPSESGVNAGWGPPLSAIALPNSYMPADNSTADHTADAWYSMRWATEPYRWETLPASFWGWTWSQADNLTASGTDGSLHPSIPAPQAAGWPFGGEAEQPQYPTRSGAMPFWGDDSQGLYHLSPSFDPPESIASSVAAGLSSIPETGPPSFPNFFRVQQAEDVSLSIPTVIPLQSPSWDPLAPVSAALPMTDFYRRSMHQEPSAPVPVRNIDSLVPPWLQTTMDHHETKPSSFDNVGANSQDSSWNVKVPEDQVEHRHST
ncbi:hypothetical protein ASPFODRAFT_148522 [Aspergillus luchuensis CBS 106.47]|uniref:Uncharacterized protein n=1 Tax=Aspergillus luchuensis (strain CBS 106.47) TaxID=1137211 RepID=A0A1M3SZG3_ASPLC|nr:hypothetical protein ASPFODRAFT_148522 [Aspergillus luchuensis CBS 106.47]